jgi:molybdopterin synthase sulfur carrier subunit
VKIKYFAWMKRTVGVPEEDVTPPATVTTVGELVEWLRNKSPGHAEALSEGASFGAAVDKRTATMDVKLMGASEVAFFPPFTGG